jgi:hypothetical protein
MSTAVGTFKVYKYDGRICKYDNGTEICALDHKLKVKGTCFNQVIATINSTDDSFQPAYSVCISDYYPKSTASFNMYSFDNIDSSFILASSSTVSAAGNEKAYAETTKTTFLDAISISLESYCKVFTKSNGVLASIFSNTLEFGKSADWLILQRDSGSILRGSNIISDFFVYDIFGQITIISEYLVPVERENFYILSIGGVSGNYTQINSDYASETSNPGYYNGSLGDNPESICIGDEYPPYVSVVTPPSGTVLLEKDFSISFSISDAAGGVDLSSIYITVSGDLSTVGNGEIINSGDVVASGAAIAGTSSSYTVTYDPQTLWLGNEHVYVTVTGTDRIPTISGIPFTCTDLNPNSLGESWVYGVADITDISASLEVIPDSDAPYVSAVSPEKYSGNNDACAALSFYILDDLTGVNLTTLNIVINSIYVVRKGIPTTSDAVILQVSGGYYFSYSKTGCFSYSERTVVYVEAYDSYSASPNKLENSWYYDNINSSSVVVDSFLPASGISRDPDRIIIQADVYDSTYSISETDTYISVDNHSVDTSKTEIYGLRDLTSVSGINYLEYVTFSGATATSCDFYCANLTGDTITGGTFTEGLVNSGFIFDLPAPYNTTTSGQVVSASGLGGLVTNADIITTLVSGVNWDGKTICSTITDVEVSDLNCYNVNSYDTSISGVIGYRTTHSGTTWYLNDCTIGVHTQNRNTTAPVSVDQYYNIYQGFNIKSFDNSFSNNAPVEIFAGAENKVRNSNDYFYNYKFYTRSIQTKELTASITGVIKNTDLSASIEPVAPVHEYGKTITVIIVATDEQGNTLNKEFSYTIEDRP